MSTTKRRNRIQTHIDTHEGEHIITAAGIPAGSTPPVNDRLHNLKIYGKSVQDGTPTPENPVPIESVPSAFDIKSTGKNLCVYNYLEVVSGMIRTLLSGTYPQLTISFKINYTLVNNPIAYFIRINYSDNSLQYITPSNSFPNANTDYNVVFVTSAAKTVTKIELENNPVVRGTMSEIQIELGVTKTQFKPYTSTTTPFVIKDINNVLHEFHSLPDGTRDEIKEGKIILRTKKQVFSYPQTGDGTDDSNKWVCYADTLSSKGYFECAHNVSADRWKSDGYMSAYCNMFTVLSNYNNTKQHTSIGRRTIDSRYRIYVHYTDLGFTSETQAKNVTNAEATAAFLNWLNPLLQTNGDLVYVLELAPNLQSVYDLHPDSIAALKSIRTVQNYTQIFTDVAVAPAISCGIRKLGNRALIGFNLTDGSGNYITDENGNKLGGMY